MTRRQLVVAMGFLLTSISIAAQQAPPRDGATTAPATGTATLTGVVITDAGERPVRRAVVAINGENYRESFVTDETGRFAFRQMPVGRYTLQANKPGLLPFSFGQKGRGTIGTPIVIAAGESRGPLTLRLQAGGVITGTVRSRDGEPLPGVQIVVLHPGYSFDTGERTLLSVGGFGLSTDDRGEYRVFALPPDDYYIVATMGFGLRSSAELRQVTAQEIDWASRQLQAGGRVGAPQTPAPAPGIAVDYVPMFHPGSPTQAGATSVSLKAGEERRGIDVMLDMTPTAKITGTVAAADGSVPAGLQVSVIANETIPGVPFSGFGTARVDAAGHFVSAGLPPGDYTIFVRVAGAPTGRGGPAPAAAAALFGAKTVTINGADTETAVRLETGVTVSGHLVFDGTAAKPAMADVRASLVALRGRTPTLGAGIATVDASGAFTLSGVAPGRYRASVTNVGAWQVQRALFEGRDILDDPLELSDQNVSNIEIHLTDQATEIAGDFVDAAGRPAQDYYIVIFPKDQKYWTGQSRRVRSTRPDSAGHYKVANLPPGDYLIAALVDVENNAWLDPSFLAQLVGASTPVALGEGEKKVQSLRIK